MYEHQPEIDRKSRQSDHVMEIKIKNNEEQHNPQFHLYWKLAEMYLDHNLVYKEKIRHYLEDQIDNILKSPLNIDIAQMRAK